MFACFYARCIMAYYRYVENYTHDIVYMRKNCSIQVQEGAVHHDILSVPRTMTHKTLVHFVYSVIIYMQC
jgi:hypothetical protein